LRLVRIGDEKEGADEDEEEDDDKVDFPPTSAPLLSP